LIGSVDSSSNELYSLCDHVALILLRVQLPKYKRDMRSVLTAGFDDILWGFGGPATLRFSLRGLFVELVIVPSTKPVITTATSSSVLTDDVIRSMTDVGRASGKVKPPVVTRLFEGVNFETASPTVQSQMLCRELKEQVCVSPVVRDIVCMQFQVLGSLGCGLAVKLHAAAFACATLKARNVPLEALLDRVESVGAGSRLVRAGHASTSCH
jgi:hypothetical protein